MQQIWSISPMAWNSNSSQYNFHKFYVAIFLLFFVETIAASVSCLAIAYEEDLSATYEPIPGNYIETLGLENKELDHSLYLYKSESKAYKNQGVFVKFTTGVEGIQLKEKESIKSQLVKNTNFVVVQYKEPLCTFTFNYNLLTRQLDTMTFGGKQATTKFFFPDPSASEQDLQSYWKSQMNYLGEKLENDANLYDAANTYFYKEYVAVSGYVESSWAGESKSTVKRSTHPSPGLDPAYDNIPAEAPYYLIGREQEIKLNLKVGDEITILAEGSITNGSDVIHPMGMSPQLHRIYEKKYDAARFGCLMAKFGKQVYSVGKGATFTIKNDESFSLFMNARDNFFKLDNGFQVWIFHNKQLIEPVSPKGFNCKLANPGSAKDLLFTPDNKLIAGVDENMTTRIWDAQSGSLLDQFNNQYDPIVATAFLVYEPVLVSLSNKGRLLYWDILSQKVVREIFLDQKTIATAEFDRNVEYLVVTLKGDTTLYLYDLYKGILNKGTAIGRELNVHNNSVTAASFSPLEDVMVSGDESGRIFIWNMTTWSPVKEIKIEDKKTAVSSFYFDRSSYTLIVSAKKGYYMPETGGSDLLYRNVNHVIDLKTGLFEASDTDRADARLHADFVLRSGDKFMSESKDGILIIVQNGLKEVLLWQKQKYENK